MMMICYFLAVLLVLLFVLLGLGLALSGYALAWFVYSLIKRKVSDTQ